MYCCCQLPVPRATTPSRMPLASGSRPRSVSIRPRRREASVAVGSAASAARARLDASARCRLRVASTRASDAPRLSPGDSATRSCSHAFAVRMATSLGAARVARSKNAIASPGARWRAWSNAAPRYQRRRKISDASDAPADASANRRASSMCDDASSLRPRRQKLAARSVWSRAAAWTNRRSIQGGAARDDQSVRTDAADCVGPADTASTAAA